MLKQNFDLITLIYIIIEKTTLGVQLYLYSQFFQPHQYWIFILMSNLFGINRLIALKTFSRQIPIVFILTFTEDIYFYYKYNKQKESAKYRLLDGRAQYAYEYLKQASKISPFYTKLIIYFSLQSQRLLTINNVLEIILLISLAINFFIRQLDQYYDFDRIFSNSQQYQINQQQIFHGLVISIINYTACMTLIKQNLQIEWFIFFYAFITLQIIISSKQSLYNRIVFFEKNPLIEKFLFHIDVDIQVFERDYFSVGAATFQKSMRFSFIQKFILLLCYVTRLNEVKKISQLQWFILLVAIISISIQLFRIISQETLQSRKNRVLKIDNLQEIKKYNQKCKSTSEHESYNEIQTIYIYLKLQPENEKDIIQFLFNSFKNANIISKEFGRESLISCRQLKNIRIDTVCDIQNLKESIKELDQVNSISIIVKKEDKNIVDFENQFKPLYKRGKNVFLVEINENRNTFRNSYQDSFIEYLNQLNSTQLHITAFNYFISHYQVFNPNIILFDLFD